MSAALRSAVIDIGMSLMLRRAGLAFWGRPNRDVVQVGRCVRAGPGPAAYTGFGVRRQRVCGRASPLPLLRERARLRVRAVSQNLKELSSGAIARRRRASLDAPRLAARSSSRAP